MGQLVEGKWVEVDVRQGEKNDKGEFIRKPMAFRGEVSEEGPHQPESGRYHLYVSYACPWAHRSLIFRVLKGLEDHIDVSVVSPLMMNDGWSFKKDFDEIPGDQLNDFEFLRDVYIKADPKFTGRVTVPILWDKKLSTIVNNESSELIRIFNFKFNELTGNTDDYYPEDLQSEIDGWNEKIYPSINNGVYRCGFATSQEAYEEAFGQLFGALNEINRRLQKEKFLCGDRLTEADIRLFPTLVRFDQVYHTHFKCNGRLIEQYQGLSRYLTELLEIKAFRKTTNMSHIKSHYYYSHDSINPSRVIAKGPI